MLKPLSPKQRAAARLLASGLSGAAVAKQLNADPATVSRWRQSHVFAVHVHEQLQALDHEATVQLQAIKARAIQRLSDLLDSPNSAISLRAAEAILDRAPGVPTDPRLVNDDRAWAEALTELYCIKETPASGLLSA